MKKSVIALLVTFGLVAPALAYQGHEAYEYAFEGAVREPIPYVAPTDPDMWSGHKMYDEVFVTGNEPNQFGTHAWVTTPVDPHEVFVGD